MKIKWKIGTLFGVLFVLVAGMFWWITKGNTALIILGEVFLLVLLIVFGVMLHRIFRPLDHLGTGLAALKDQDFTSQLRFTGSAETDKLVEVYNRMMANIREERRYQQEQHYFLQNLIESLPVGLLVLDYDQRLNQYNPVAQRILGIVPEDRGKVLGDTGMRLGKELEGQVPHEGITYNLGGAKYLRAYVDTFRRRGFFQKFIIVEEASAEVLRIERQSYGKVIRMMAHEVKNSVGAVNSILASLPSASGLTNEEKAGYLRMVMDRNLRLNAFMENFARVARLPEAGKETLDLFEIVNSVYHLMKLRFQDCPVEFTLAAEPVIFTGNREQMEQALINIILNAFEAITGEGKVHLELTAETLTVTDTGSGISGEARTGLFTPFFTTKPAGQGVGLTLVREILHNHKLGFELGSTGGTTTFVIRLK